MKWQSKDISCDICIKLYGEDKTPCHECDKVELMECNYLAVNVWRSLTNKGRPSSGGFGGLMHILPSEIKNMCEVYDYGLDIYEKVLIIDSIYTNMQNEKMQKDRERQNKKATSGLRR